MDTTTQNTMEVLEDKDSSANYECCLEPDENEDVPGVQLNEGIDLRDLGKGTMFEVQERSGDPPPEPQAMGTCSEPDHVVSEMNMAAQDYDEEDEDDEDLSPFQRIAKTMVDITPDGGVKKQILQHGIGGVVPPGSLVRVHYSGRLEYADEPFDSSYLQRNNHPRAFRLGDGQLVPGLDIAVASMKKKETSMFLIQPEYFYGELGCPPRIPPKAVVLFRIELESFSDRTELADYYNLSREERKQAPMSLIIKVVNVEKTEANEFFKNKIYRRAMQKYRRAIDILEECHLADAEAEQLQKKTMFTVYTNAALCADRLGEAGRVIYFANRALDINSTTPKAWYLKGKGLRMQGEFSRAEVAFKRAQQLGANPQEISKALEELDTKLKQFKQIEKDTYQRMFKNLSVGDEAGQKDNIPKTIQQESVDKLSQVSEEFKEVVRAQLQAFLDNPAASVLPFQSARYSLGEIHCLVETADDMGLGVEEVGEGSNLHYRFSKTKAPKEPS